MNDIIELIDSLVKEYFLSEQERKILIGAYPRFNEEALESLALQFYLFNQKE